VRTAPRRPRRSPRAKRRRFCPSVVVDEPTRGDRLCAGGDLVLGVEGVAQRGPREAALPQRLFGVPVIGGDHGRVLRNRVEVGRVGHVTHACLPGSLDGGAVLGHAAADNVGADQQQPLPARERLGEGLRPIKVGLPDLRPAPGEVGERLGAPVVRVTSEAGTRASTSSAVKRPSWPDAPVITVPIRSASPDAKYLVDCLARRLPIAPGVYPPKGRWSVIPTDPSTPDRKEPSSGIEGLLIIAPERVDLVRTSENSGSKPS